MTVNAGVKKDSEDDNAISVKQTFGAIRMLNVIVSFLFVCVHSGLILNINFSM